MNISLPVVWSFFDGREESNQTARKLPLQAQTEVIYLSILQLYVMPGMNRSG